MWKICAKIESPNERTNYHQYFSICKNNLFKFFGSRKAYCWRVSSTLMCNWYIVKNKQSVMKTWSQKPHVWSCTNMNTTYIIANITWEKCPSCCGIFLWGLCAWSNRLRSSIWHLGAWQDKSWCIFPAQYIGYNKGVKRVNHPYVHACYMQINIICSEALFLYHWLTILQGIPNPS